MNHTIKIRRKKLRDLFFAIKLIKASFPHWYRRVPYLLFTTFVAECDNKLAGFITFRKTGKFGLMAVSKQYRKFGIAMILFNEAFCFLKKRNIPYCVSKVRADNKLALKFYTKAVGFQIYKFQHRPLLGDVYLLRKYL